MFVKVIYLRIYRGKSEVAGSNPGKGNIFCSFLFIFSFAAIKLTVKNILVHENAYYSIFRGLRTDFRFFPAASYKFSPRFWSTDNKLNNGEAPSIILDIQRLTHAIYIC